MTRLHGDRDPDGGLPSETNARRTGPGLLETQLQEREGHNDEVEDVPALLEVVLGAHGHQLHGGLDGEGGREELQVKVGHGYDCS